MDGLYLNCAMNSRGIQLSGGVGKEMANLVIEGHTEVDMFGMHPDRFQKAYAGNQEWVHQATHEAEVISKHNYSVLGLARI